MADGPDYQAEFEAALKAAQQQQDQPAPAVGSPTPPAAVGSPTPPAPGLPDHQAELEAALARGRKTISKEPFGPPQQPWKSGFWPWSTDETGKANWLDPSAGIPGKVLDAFTLSRNINTGQQQIYDPSTGAFDPSFVERNLNFATLANPTSAAARAEGVILPGMSTARQVPTSAELTAAGTPQRGPGGQFLPGGTFDPRNLTAATRSDAITDLAKAPVTGPAVPIREQVGTFIADPVNRKGFAPAEIKELDDFAKGGTWTSKIGSLLEEHAGHLLASGVGGVMGFGHGDYGGMIGAMAGGSMVGPLIRQAVKPIVGWPFKKWEDARASSALDDIGEMLRSRSPLGEQSLKAARPEYLGRAIPSLLEPTPMAPQPQPGQFPPMQPPPGPPRPTGEYFNPYGGTAPSRFPFGTRLPQGLLGGWA